MKALSTILSITLLLFTSVSASNSFQLLLPVENVLQPVENGDAYNVTNGSITLTMLLPERDPFVRIQFSTHAGQQYLLSKSVPYEHIVGLSPEEMLPWDNEQDIYTKFKGNPNGNFGFYGQSMDSVYEQEGNIYGVITRPIDFGNSNTLFLNILDPHNRTVCVSLFKGDNMSEVKQELKRVKKLYKEVVEDDYETMDIDVLLDGRGTERGISIQIVPYISSPELGYIKKVELCETVKAHGPVEEGVESQYSFKSVPVLDSMELYFFNPRQPYKSGYTFINDFSKTLTRIEEISMCRWIPETFFSIVRDGTTFVVQNGCIDKTPRAQSN